MSRARKLYPNFDFEWGGPGDYMPIIESFGEIVAIQDIDGCRDTLVLLRREDAEGCQYGFLVFGWGSCCGCDALQGCTSYEDVDALIDSLEASIIWMPDACTALAWFRERDWAAQWYARGDGFDEFLTSALDFLARECEREEMKS